jgi:hypothetical protein
MRQHKTGSTALAALLHCSGNFTYVGRNCHKFLFDGPDDLTEFEAFAAVIKYFSEERWKRRCRNRLKAEVSSESAES